MDRRSSRNRDRDIVGVAVLDVEGRIASADDRFARLVGEPEVGRALEDAVLENQRDLVRLIVDATSGDWAEA